MNKDTIIGELKEENTVLKEQVVYHKAQHERLMKLILGFKSERFVPQAPLLNQPTLFDSPEDEPVSEQNNKVTVSYERKRRKHNGRNKLPEHLPVEEVTIEPVEDTAGLKKIGEEITETLKYTPASLVKKRTIRPKYAKANSEGVLIAPLPERPINKGIAEASLLAHILVNKFVDHLPFYRQIQIFNREYGWEVNKSTLNDWMAACTKLLEPLYEKMLEQILSSGYLQADESPIKVLDSAKKGKAHQGYMWVYYTPVHKIVILNYRKGRGQHGPKEILKNYQGFLQVDGYTVYDKIAKLNPSIELAGCMAHVRRKYFDAKDEHPERAKFVLGLIRDMYLQERELKQANSTPEEKTAYRKKHLKPIMSKWWTWMEAQSTIVLPKSKLGKALTYTINQWHKIQVIVDNGSLELDNNLIENSIRPLALGRKNYLFAGSHSGAERIAIMYSMLATCKKNDVNPFLWLKDVLTRLPNQSIQNLDELLPTNWTESNNVP